MPNTIKDFEIGQRVQMHPATDFWMRGARYGNIVKLGRIRISVKLDKLPRPVVVHPDNLMDAS